MALTPEKLAYLRALSDEQRAKEKAGLSIIRPPSAFIEQNCTNLGPATGETRPCQSCNKTVMEPVHECRVYGRCTVKRLVTASDGAPIRCCAAMCPSRNLEAPVHWAYGVTTVPSRRATTLPITLASLKHAGFDKPRLFVDGDPDALSWQREFGLDVTARPTPLRTHGNWILSLYELYIREPMAARYAVFQDDFVTYRNLRQYLERSVYPLNGYCNLYTFPSNMPDRLRAAKRPAPLDGFTGWYLSNQMGRGAVALVFDKQATLALLSSKWMVERPMDAQRGWKKVDGGIVDSLKLAGVSEYVHSPSLVQHIGDTSSMGNRPHPKAPTFRGEEFNAVELLSASSAAAARS